MNEQNQIIIYQTDDGQTSVDVRMEGETVWLSQQQMAELFDKDRTVIGRHIRNIYKEGELDKDTTCAFFAHMGIDQDQIYNTTLYNLDMIISVGYRVNSKRGTQFRIWANRILKEYLVKGYAINNQLAQQKYEELSQLVSILGRTIQSNPALKNEDSRELINVVTDYNFALDTLDRYDYQQLTIDGTTPEAQFRATYDNAMAAIRLLKEKFGESRWFGNEKDDSFKSSIGQICESEDYLVRMGRWRGGATLAIYRRKNSRSERILCSKHLAHEDIF